MNTPTHEFVSVDMRGLKAALVARARAERVSVSRVVRRAVERELPCVDAPAEVGPSTIDGTPSGSSIKLSIRLRKAEVDRLDRSARLAGLSRGAFLAGLLAGIPSLSGGPARRPSYLAELTASSAELSTLSRNVHQLGSLLRRGDVRQAQAYRRRLDTLSDDVRAHLHLAAAVLAELQPARAARKAIQPSRPSNPQPEGDRHGHVP